MPRLVITCCWKVRSETFRLFLAILMLREFSASPKPCNKRCETVRLKLPLSEGLKSLR